MKKELPTASQIFEKTMQRVSPLPCQERYARDLAKILSMHIHRNQLIDEGWSPDELPSMSAIVVAPTGQGKTYLIRKMTEVLGLNLITVDGSSLVGEGYKGSALSQRIEAAMKTAPSEAAFAQSILFVDEVDKLRHYDTEYDRINGMSSLLQLFNNGTIAVETIGPNGRKTIHIDVSRFAILLGGAFVGLEDIVRERLYPKAKIGFSITGTADKMTNSELLKLATLDDMARYGMMPELLGRIGSVLSIQPLKLEDYRQLLTADAGSLTAKYRAYFGALYGISFEIADAGVEAIAARCMKSATGARAVTPLVNDMMRGAIAAVEDKETICKVILSADEGGCCVRYEHGQRKPRLRFGQHGMDEILSDTDTELPIHRVKQNNERATIRTLLRYYKNASGSQKVVPLLEAFLDCMVPFLRQKCRPTEFTLKNLVKLAEATEKIDRPKSAFDIIMEDNRSTNSPAYRLFNRLYTQWSARELVKALNTIRDYLYEKHGPCQVLFIIPKGR